MTVHCVNKVVRGVVRTLLTDPLTTRKNRPPGGEIQCIYYRPLSACSPLHFSPRSGSGSLRLFDPNIWCPLCSKLKNNPDDATKKSQSTSTSRRRLTSNLRPKPTPLQQPSTQTLPTITEAVELTFDDILEVQLQ
jgi:hypothetical protein